jgi:hypothetical protein
MKRITTLRAVPALLGLLAGAAQAQDPTFQVCKSTYALCTTASCSETDDPLTVACACDVRINEFSLGAQACGSEGKPRPGDTLKSRYYPVKAFVACNNDSTWANCLDAECTVDDRVNKATCQCAVAHGGAPYVITGDTYTTDTCTSGIISSATVDSIFQVTEFLKTNPDLRPFNFKVLNVAR